MEEGPKQKTAVVTREVLCIIKLMRIGMGIWGVFI